MAWHLGPVFLQKRRLFRRLQYIKTLLMASKTSPHFCRKTGPQWPIDWMSMIWFLHAASQLRPALSVWHLAPLWVHLHFKFSHVIRSYIIYSIIIGRIRFCMYKTVQKIYKLKHTGYQWQFDSLFEYSSFNISLIYYHISISLFRG
jgi:hypothetical protein